MLVLHGQVFSNARPCQVRDIARRQRHVVRKCVTYKIESSTSRNPGSARKDVVGQPDSEGPTWGEELYWDWEYNSQICYREMGEVRAVGIARKCVFITFNNIDLASYRYVIAFQWIVL